MGNEITDWRKAEKDFRKAEKLKKVKEKEAAKEQKQIERSEKLESLRTKKQEQYERRKQKLQYQQLKRETSTFGRLSSGIREQQQKIKSRQRPQRQITSAKPAKAKQAKVGKAGEDYIVINGHLYQKKGTVSMSKSNKIKKKKSDGESITI